MSREPSAEPRPAAPDCARVRALIYDLIDGELGGDPGRAVRVHLDHCNECRREWQCSVHAEQALNAARQQIPPPGDLRAGFYTRLASDRQARMTRGQARLRLIPPALTAALLITTGLWLGLNRYRAKTSVHTMVQASASARRPEYLAQSLIGRSPGVGLSPPAVTTPFRPSVRAAGGAAAGALADRRASQLASSRPSISSRFRAAEHLRSQRPGRLQQPIQLVRAERRGGRAAIALDDRIADAQARAADMALSQPDDVRTPSPLGDQDIHVTDEDRGFSGSLYIPAGARSSDVASVVTVEASSGSGETNAQQ